MAFAWVHKELYDSLDLEREDWHDDVPFHGHVLMDDDVPIEPELGVRPWMAGRALEACAGLVFGEGAINLSKKEEEGTFAVEQLNWGIHMNTERETVRHPEVKVSKLQIS